MGLFGYGKKLRNVQTKLVCLLCSSIWLYNMLAKKVNTSDLTNPSICQGTQTMTPYIRNSRVAMFGSENNWHDKEQAYHKPIFTTTITQKLNNRD